jgi:formylglycine-generating enzyme required for sulfatase activity
MIRARFAWRIQLGAHTDYQLRIVGGEVALARLEDRGRRQVNIWSGAHGFTVTPDEKAACEANQNEPERLVARAAARGTSGRPTCPAEWLATDFGAEAWDRLPLAIRSELAPLANGEATVRLHLELEAAASSLPWEVLGVAEKDGTRPGLQGNWEIIRHRPNPDLPPLGPADRTLRTLVVVGAQYRDPNESTSVHDVGDVVRAIEASCVTRVVAAVDSIPDRGTARPIPEADRLRSTDDLRRAITADGGCDVLHFIGHSATWLGSDAGGVDRLEIAVEGTQVPISMRIGELRHALAEARTRLVVVQACLTRERVAAALLDPLDDPLAALASGTATVGAPDHVITFGAMLPARITAPWSGAFYAALAARSTVGDAARRARRKAFLQDENTLPLAWLPLHFSRTLDQGPLVDAEVAVLGRYLAHVRGQCAQLLGRFRRQPQDLVKVHVPLRTREQGQGAAPSSFVDLLTHGRRWVLGGEPGAGKTTTLRYHAWSLAGGRQRVPVLVRLADHVARDGRDGCDATDPRELLRAAAARRGLDEDERELLVEALVQRCKRGDVDFLLDGLDEVPTAQLGLVRDLATNLASDAHPTWSRCRVIVTTRRFAYRGRLHQTEFGEADLLPLDEDGRRVLLTNWFALHGRADAETLAQSWASWFADQAPRSRALRELSLNPLHLTRMADTILRGGTPASARHRLYEQLLDGVFERDHEDDEIAAQRRLPHREQAEIVLAWLAFAMTRRELEVIEDRSDALRLVRAADDPAVGEALSHWGDASTFLDAVADRTAVFGPQDRQAKAGWRFGHRNFQELLTARWLLRVWRSGGDQPVERVLDSATIRQIAEPRPQITSLHDVLRSDRLWLESQGLDPNDDRRLEVLRQKMRKAGRNETRATQDAKQYFDFERELGRVSDYWTEPIVLLAGQLEDSGDAARLLAGLLERGMRGLALRALARIDQLALDDLFDLHGRLQGWRERSELFGALPDLLAEPEVDRAFRSWSAVLGAETDRRELWFGLTALDGLGARHRQSAAADAAAHAILAKLPQPTASLFDPLRWVRAPDRGDPQEFRLGSPTGEADRFPDEGPVERAKVRAAFWVGRDPITLGEYLPFHPGHHQSPQGEDSLPVVNVSWFEADLFCRWLRHHGLDARLPTEMEWEYAARAGSDHAWWWGSDRSQLDRHAHFDQDPRTGVPRVTGRGTPNAWGLRDVLGNVWEWCSDWYGPYEDHGPGVQVDRGGPAHGSARVARGGSWFDPAVLCRTACRNCYDPAFVRDVSGFRAVLSSAPSRVRGR